jgi:signal transduction histidine kinase
MTRTGQWAYRCAMRTTEAAGRPTRSWLGLVPPGWPSDVAVALSTGTLQVVFTLLASQNLRGRLPLDALGLALLVAGPVALLGRRRWPLPTLLVIAAVTVLYFALGYPFGPAWLALLVAFWTAVTGGQRLAAWLTAGVATPVFVALTALFARTPVPSLEGLVAHLGWLVVVLAAAEVVRVRRERMLEAARTRAEEDRRRVGEERLRIARELHDVLAHNISLINVQAGVALHLMDEQPGQSRTALVAIKQASSDALRELRSVLDILRQGGEAPRSPTSGLDSLDGLVANAEAAGLEVRTRVEGTPRPLPAGVDLAAFRIVQEALTNITRHAGRPAAATVLVAYGDHDLTVQVDDNGNGVESAFGRRPEDSDRQDRRSGRSGNGIRGMRERAAALGGELAAGPRASGGFRVSAHLPLPEGSGGPRRGAPVDQPEGSGEPPRGAPVDQPEGSGEPPRGAPVDQGMRP